MPKVYVAGHMGMVGSAIVRRLSKENGLEILTRSRKELDLFNQRSVIDFLKSERPDYVFIAAAKVGGILANDQQRADFIYQNLLLETNLIGGAFEAGIKRLCFLGSSCVYPRLCPQPIKEEYLLTGPLEKTNEPYAVAKIAGIKLCESFNHQYGTSYTTLMPANLYGPNDNYDLVTGHMLAALLKKAHKAKVAGTDKLDVWGTGTPKRELLYVDDLADACCHVMKNPPSHSILNVGSGTDHTISEIARFVMKTVGFRGELEFDASKPDGTPQKLLDVSRMNCEGWKAKTNLFEGLQLTYAKFLSS